MLKNLRSWSLFGAKKDTAPSFSQPSECYYRKFLESWCEKPELLSLEFLSEDLNQEQPDFSSFENSIRLVVFSDSCGRRELLFDSKTVAKLPGPTCSRSQPQQSTPTHRPSAKSLSRSSTIPASLGKDAVTTACRMKLDSVMRAQAPQRPYTPKYCQSKLPNDSVVLRELIFGNMDLCHKSNCMKLHATRCPLRIYCSTILQKDPPSNNSSFSESWMHRNVSVCHFVDPASATPHCELVSPTVLVPSCTTPTANNSHSAQFICGSAGSIPEEPDCYSSSPYGSNNSQLQSPKCFNSTGVPLRSAKAFVTSMSSHQLAAQEDIQRPNTLPAARRRVDRYGICVSYSPFHDSPAQQDKFYNYFFTHNSLFEAFLHEISMQVLEAFSVDPQVTRLDPLERLLDALNDLRSKVRRLYLSPLLTNPAWLTLSCKPNLSSMFVQQGLTPALQHLNHSQHGHFLSTLISVILTYHIAWIETVGISRSHQNWMDPLATCQITPEHARGCCPQWMQQCQLYGAMGYPRTLARTVVVGSCESLVLFVIYIVSYFIRCSDVLSKSHNLPDLKGKFERSGIKSSASSSASSSSDYCSELGHSPDCGGVNQDHATASPSSDYHSDADADRFCNKNLLSLPLSNVLEPCGSCHSFSHRHLTSLGRHMIRGVSSKLVPMAAVQGTTDKQILDSAAAVKKELGFPLEHDLCGEPIGTSVLVIVDTDNYKVNVKSLVANSTRVRDSGLAKPALSVHRLLMSLQCLIQMGMPPAVCLTFLESGLQKLERSGKALAALLRRHGDSGTLSATQLASAARVDVTDLPLLLAVASTQYLVAQPQCHYYSASSLLEDDSCATTTIQPSSYPS